MSLNEMSTQCSSCFIEIEFQTMGSKCDLGYHESGFPVNVTIHSAFDLHILTRKYIGIKQYLIFEKCFFATIS